MISDDASPLSDTSAEDTRATAILTAACRVIARSGIRRTRMQDVATEAKVSKALIHYYFKSREELLTQAYQFADGRARKRIYAAIASVESAAIRLRQLLLLYFEEESDVTEDWILWSELSTTAAFDADLRPLMESSYAGWMAWIGALVEEAISDGSLPESLNPIDVAQRLTAVIDGLGLGVVRGLISRERAQSLMSASLDLECSATAPDSRAGTTATAVPPATGYLRLLARLLGDAIAQLGSLAASDDEREAIQNVCAVLDRAAGGAVTRLADSGR